MKRPYMIAAAFLGMTGLAGNAAAQEVCRSLSSRAGWVSWTFAGDGQPRVSSISGSWTVDAANYAPVGPQGHTGADGQRLEPFSEYKAVQGFPFGALLTRSESGAVSILQPGTMISGTRLMVGINDSHTTLGDNQGEMRICFSDARTTSGPVSVPVTAAASSASSAGTSRPGISASCQAERNELTEWGEELRQWRSELNGMRRRLSQWRRELEATERHLNNVTTDPYGIAGEVRRYNTSQYEQERREYNRENDAYDREAREFNEESAAYNRRLEASRSCQ